MKRNRFINLKAVGWMLFLVAALSACREDDAGTPQAKMRTISLNFPAIQPYTASRADNNVSAIEGESTFHTADIWVFDSNQTGEDVKAAAYKHIEDAERYTTNTGELRTELTIPREITNVDIYVITNNSAQGLNANSTRTALQAATFSEKPASNKDTKLASNGLLMSRIIEDVPVASLSEGYDANTQLPLERGVAKIACFFAKESESTQATITGITVSGATNMGCVFPEVVQYNDGIIPRPNEEAEVPTEAGTMPDFSMLPTSLPVSAVLDEGETLERDEDNEDAQDYIDRLVNEIQANHTNDYYLFEADANEMKVSISYTLGTSEIKTAEVSLDKDVIRNHYVVITGKVKGGNFQLTYSVLDWDQDVIKVDYTNELSYTEGTWNLGDDDNPILELIEGGTTAHFLRPDETAEITFTINSPSAATWRAALEGDVNAFEFVGDNSGVAFNEGKAVPQTLRIRCTDPESEDPHRVTLHVYAYIGGTSYEVDLTGSEDEEQ